MIQAEFFELKGLKYGFKIGGHADYSDSGSDIVCAAVSSAVQLTVNIIENFSLCPHTNVDESDNSVKCIVGKKCNDCDRLIASLMMHLKAISQEFPNTITITNTENSEV